LKNKTKLIIGIFLISGIMILGYMGTTNMVNGDEPIDDDPNDPGNARGPGIFDSLPTGPLEFANSPDAVLTSLNFL